MIVELENHQFKAIVSDLKQDRHTVDGKVGLDGSVIEFIVDPENLNHKAKLMGTVGCIDGFEGNIVEIRREP